MKSDALKRLYPRCKKNKKVMVGEGGRGGEINRNKQKKKK
jgi:hypothetical protein